MKQKSAHSRPDPTCAVDFPRGIPSREHDSSAARRGCHNRKPQTGPRRQTLNPRRNGAYSACQRDRLTVRAAALLADGNQRSGTRPSSPRVDRSDRTVRRHHAVRGRDRRRIGTLRSSRRRRSRPLRLSLDVVSLQRSKKPTTNLRIERNRDRMPSNCDLTGRHHDGGVGGIEHFYHRSRAPSDDDEMAAAPRK